ncbi:MAG: restriction endonuclease [Rhodospirillales bacterium]|nr:restriction endonuclease [Rhodospirillales bacterium]
MLRQLGGSGRPNEVIDRIARDMELPEVVQNETTPSGELRFPKNVHWARFYLSREGLIDASTRGVWTLTVRGKDAHLSLEQASDIFFKWVKLDAERRGGETEQDAGDEPDGIELSPGVADYRVQAIEVLLRLPPSGFERLSQRLLRESGFTEVVVTGKSNDGGIDGYGVLQINPLVSFKVLFQCKRYRDTVSPATIRDFRGAMTGRADKGIIITTGAFTTEARREATRDGAPPIELIDGDKLVDMMANLGLGLRAVQTYELEPSFFNEFEK